MNAYQIAAALERVEREQARQAAQLDRIEAALGTVAGIATRKHSRTEQAKKAGCSVRTLLNRERRARVALIKTRIL